MKIINYSKWILAIGITFISSNCINQTDCCFPDNGSHSIIVRSFDGLGNEITNTGAVNDVKLYLFDENYKFVDSIVTQENKIELLNYPFETNLRVVGWGNASSSRINHEGLLTGSSLKDRFMNLNAVSDSISSTSTDLFYGSDEFELFPVVGQNVFTLRITRSVACIAVNVLGINVFAKKDINNLTLQINNLSENISFSGVTSDDITSHIVRFNEKSEDEWRTPDFYVIPSSQVDVPTELDLYYNNTVLKRITTDTNGDPFDFKAGERYLITVDFRGVFKVTVNTIPWNFSSMEQEF